MKFVCKYCNKKCLTHIGLLQHKNIHADDKWHNCVLCNFVSNRHKVMTYHLAIHKISIRWKNPEYNKYIIGYMHARELMEPEIEETDEYYWGYNKPLPLLD